VLQRYLRADASNILLEDVRRVSRILRQRATANADGAGGHASEPLWVHELLQGAAPVLPAPRQRADPHPSLAPRLDRLRLAQETRDYAKMVGDICGREESGEREAAEMQTYKSSIGVGLNLIVSMATMFCVGFYAGGTEDEPRGTRVSAAPAC
jgi:hypothetical protein